MPPLKKIWKNKPFNLYRVRGLSMEPTLPDGKIVLVLQWFRAVKPQQIVVIHHAGLDKIKRIRAVEGDEIFVVGDNPAVSTDSRSFGWVARSAVTGKVLI